MNGSPRTREEWELELRKLREMAAALDQRVMEFNQQLQSLATEDVPAEMHKEFAQLCQLAERLSQQMRKLGHRRPD